VACFISALMKAYFHRANSLPHSPETDSRGTDFEQLAVQSQVRWSSTLVSWGVELRILKLP